jgi:hypothetical protein
LRILRQPPSRTAGNGRPPTKRAQPKKSKPAPKGQGQTDLSSNPDFKKKNWSEMPSKITDYFRKGAENIKTPGYKPTLTNGILAVMNEASTLSILTKNTTDMDRLQ